MLSSCSLRLALAVAAQEPFLRGAALCFTWTDVAPGPGSVAVEEGVTAAQLDRLLRAFDASSSDPDVPLGAPWSASAAAAARRAKPGAAGDSAASVLPLQQSDGEGDAALSLDGTGGTGAAAAAGTHVPGARGGGGLVATGSASVGHSTGLSNGTGGTGGGAALGSASHHGAGGTPRADSNAVHAVATIHARSGNPNPPASLCFLARRCRAPQGLTQCPRVAPQARRCRPWRRPAASGAARRGSAAAAPAPPAAPPSTPPPGAARRHLGRRRSCRASPLLLGRPRAARCSG